MSAMSAVQSLTATQRALAATQNQISTGLRVSSAQDNASYWSIATKMRSRIGTIQAVDDSLDLTQGLLNVTNVALTNILSAMNAIKVDVLRAQTAGVNLDALQTDLVSQQTDIETYAQDATFNGQNLLDRNWTGTAAIVESTQYDGTTFLSGSGTENYSWSDDQGTTYGSEDQFTITDPDVPNAATYTNLGSAGPNPFTELRIPVGESGDQLQETDFDTSNINMFGYGYEPMDYDQPDPDYYNEYVKDTVTNADQTTGPTNGTYESRQFAYGGRDYTPEYYDERSSARSFVAATHSYTGTGYLDSFGYDVLPYEQGAMGASSYASPLGSEEYTVMPEASITTMSLTGNKEYNYIQNSDGSYSPKASDYDLTASDLASYQTMVEQNVARTTKGIAELGGEIASLSAQHGYNTSLIDSLTTGVGSLVDADMNQASTRLAALQTQQQLGVQSLSIANSNSQLILKLFQ
jgi:flagellin